MPGILGQMQPRSILGGSYAPIRQVAMAPQTQPMQPQASPFAMMGGGGPPAYGSDEWAAKYGGLGSLLWREMARAMAGGEGGPLGFLDPRTEAFSPELRALLGPQFQGGKKGK